MKTTNRLILAGLVAALTYFGYNYLKDFNADSVGTLVNATHAGLSYVVQFRYIISLIWVIALGVVTFCITFGLGSSERYGIWCVIRAFLKLPVDIFGWLFLKKKNPLM